MNSGIEFVTHWHQRESFLSMYIQLQSRLARLCLWINLPMFWLVTVSLFTGNLGTIVRAHPHAVMGTWLVWLFLTHFLGTSAAFWELSWNPYIRCPSLKGKIAQWEEEQLMRENNWLVSQTAKLPLSRSEVQGHKRG